ncbi:MAG: L-aspartate oxidase [Verrucomicrobiia bacterium]
MRRDYDFLVLGSGLAGLSFALKAAAHGKVAVLTKKHRAESNTNYAQGGIACVTSKEDSFELHVRDTLDAGAGLCHEDVVRGIVAEGPERIRELIDLGIRFTERQAPFSGELDLGKEGGHSKRRILHVKDMTGRTIEQAMLNAVAQHPAIDVFEDYFAIDLITSTKLGLPGPARVLGTYALDSCSGQVFTFAAPVLLLATGGCGKCYRYTTNPSIATGDGVAMAYRAGVPIANMEFIQFHPTCLYHPKANSFLISEALRGEGAVLINRDGREFAPDHDPRGSLAPRDIVARAIDSEMKATGADCVYLDITHKSREFLEERFPTIYQRCLELGIDPATDPIPVVPAAHYQCGGVLTKPDGSTSLHGLFAAGEVACTGLHGANRLASNSLLEAVVIAHRAALAAREVATAASPIPNLPPWEEGDATDPDELVVLIHTWRELRYLMWDYVGIVRSDKRLRRARARLQALQQEIQEYYWDFKVTGDLLELRNLALVASLVVECALARKESRGLHWTLDYPETLPEPLDTIISAENDA